MSRVSSPLSRAGSEAAPPTWEVPHAENGALHLTSVETNARQEFALRPSQVIWEMTRAYSSRQRSPKTEPADLRRTLPTAEAFQLIDDLAAMRVPLLALTGGNPLLRLDLQPIIQYASRRGVRTSLTVPPTHRLTPERIAELKECGLLRLGLWLNGSTAALHDTTPGVAGTYAETLAAVGWCNEAQLSIQINTLVSRRNFSDVEAMIELLTRFNVALWNVVFSIPSGPEQLEKQLTADAQEEVFAHLYAASMRVPFQIKTTDGQPYPRYVLQQRARESRRRVSEAEAINSTVTNDIEGSVFVNQFGDVYPSRSLPVSAGNVLFEALSKIYNESPLFLSLRDRSQLKGKCGHCSTRQACGGSRARAYAMTGDLLAEDPCCAYQPAS